MSQPQGVVISTAGSQVTICCAGGIADIELVINDSEGMGVVARGKLGDAEALLVALEDFVRRCREP